MQNNVPACSKLSQIVLLSQASCEVVGYGYPVWIYQLCVLNVLGARHELHSGRLVFIFPMFLWAPCGSRCCK